MSIRIVIRLVVALYLLGGALPAWASTGSPFDADRAGDGATRGLSPSSAQAPASWLRGIDVSHWNGTINWQKVAGPGGKSFAVMKATDGRSYVDPTYVGNRNGALAAGLFVSAYHFARPDNTNGDARVEADHFVNVAGLGVGDIIPVLDLERTGGLSKSAVVNWVWTWVKEVKRRTGVKPMIYTGYYGWLDRTGNTREFADAGYKLWVANWYVNSPSVPASNWGGHGWTFWQYTDHGNVPGMNGPVDLDYFGGSNLAPVRIPLLNVTTNGVGTVTSKPAGITCGTDCSSVFDPGSTVTLTATPDPGAVLVRWNGACSGAVQTCQVKALGNRTASAAFGYTLTTALTGFGQGSVTSSTGGIACDGSVAQVCAANYVAGNSVTLTATPQAGSQFDGWTGACDGSLAYTCTVTVDHAYNVSASFADDTPPTPTITPPGRLNAPALVSFDEPVHGVTTSDFMIRIEGRTSGIPAAVVCDNQHGQSVSCSTGDVIRASVQAAAPLVPGQHYEVVVNPAGVIPQVVDRAGNPAAETPDSFRALTSFEESGLPVGWGWRNVHDPRASHGSYATSNDPGASASLSFRGGPLVWHTLRGPGAGVAHVVIDGHGAGVFDLSAPRSRVVSYRFAGLGTGPHTIRVDVLRGRNAGVAVDGFGMNGVPAPDGDVSYRWAVHHASGASGGAFATTDDPGAAVRFQFRGTAIDWITMRGSDQGRAALYLDGKLHATYDNYASARTFGVTHAITGLTDSVHTIRVVVLGTARPAATGSWVSVDRFEIA
jgi:GH25 family lysozyme M1 (1,4-beta-N-acetylmuramidase)